MSTRYCEDCESMIIVNPTRSVRTCTWCGGATITRSELASRAYSVQRASLVTLTAWHEPVRDLRSQRGRP